MQVKTRTINHHQSTYLLIQDSEGADASFLMQDDETMSQALARHIKDEQLKMQVIQRRIARMNYWLDAMNETVLS